MIGSKRYYIGKDNKIHYRRVIKMSQGKDDLYYFFQDGCVKTVGIPARYVSDDANKLRGVTWREEDINE